LESDIRYFSRRANEEMIAASRAITPAARERRLYLVGVYLDRLRGLNAPVPFDELKLAEMMKPAAGQSLLGSAPDGAKNQKQAELA
jgi:hypothetical protein